MIIQVKLTGVFSAARPACRICGRKQPDALTQVKPNPSLSYSSMSPLFFHTLMAVFCEMDKFPNDINLGFRILKFMKVACSVVGEQKDK